MIIDVFNRQRHHVVVDAGSKETENIIGSFFVKHGKRDRSVIATKFFGVGFLLTRAGKVR